MRAVVKEAREVGAVRLREVPTPEPGPGEVLVQVRAATICGSDLHIWEWEPAFHQIMPIPVVLGHEFAGVVAACGADVSGFTPGQRVLTESVIYCGQCRHCRRGDTNICTSFQVFGVHRDGGFAEYTVAPAKLLHALPEELSFEQAATVEPTTVATHAVFERSGISPGDLALIVGPGPIGLLAAQAARVAGARVVISGADADVPVRLPLAERLGFATINSQREDLSTGLRRLTGRQPVDAVLECSGAPAAVGPALDVLSKGGAMTLVALYPRPMEIDFSVLVRRQQTLVATYCGTWRDTERSIEMIADGRIQVEPLLSHFALEEAERAFQAALNREVMKPLLVIE